MSRLIELLNGPRALPAVLLIAFVLASPALITGFFLDDYALLAAVDGLNPVADPWNVYTFASGNPAQMTQLIEDGPFPWFTRLDIRVRFFRPLSSATMQLDRWLFGDTAWPYHLHSILWYLAILLILGLLLRRVLPGSLGVLTLAVYAVAATHWLPVAWWAHRNTLVACAFGFGGVLAYVRWRETQRRPAAMLALMAFALALLGGESGFSLLGYVAAYEFLGAPGSLSRRILALVPVSFFAGAYLLWYALSGHGVIGTGCYTNPMREPLAFLSTAPQRFLILAANQFFSWPAEFPAMIPKAVWPSAAIGVIALVFVIIALRSVWDRLSPEEQRGVRWLCVGGLFSVVPFLAPFTSGRLLLAPSLGGSVAIAVIIREGRREWKRNRLRDASTRRRALGTLARAFVVLHLILAPAAWFILSPAFAALNHRMTHLTETIEIDDACIAHQQAMLLSVPEPSLGVYAVAMRMHNGHPKPTAWRPLSLAPCNSTLARIGPNEFELTLDGEMLATLPEQIARDPGARLTTGAKLHFKAFDVTVLDAGQFGPKRIAFRFPASLEDPQYVWLTWRDGRLRQFQMPNIGETAFLKWSTVL